MELVGDLGGPGIWQLGERVKGKPSCTCAQAMSGVCVCVSVCVCVCLGQGSPEELCVEGIALKAGINPSWTLF